MLGTCGPRAWVGRHVWRNRQLPGHLPSSHARCGQVSPARTGASCSPVAAPRLQGLVQARPLLVPVLRAAALGRAWTHVHGVPRGGACHRGPASPQRVAGPPLRAACTLTGPEPATPRTGAKGRQQALSLAWFSETPAFIFSGHPPESRPPGLHAVTISESLQLHLHLAMPSILDLLSVLCPLQ